MTRRRSGPPPDWDLLWRFNRTAEDEHDHLDDRASLDFGSAWSPNADICETADSIVIMVELAGVDPASIDLTFEDGVLTVAGTRELTDLGELVRRYQMEVSFGRFVRSFRVHTSIDSEGISAAYRDGFLRISLPKKINRRRRVVEIG